MRLRELREGKFLTRPALAQLAGVSEATIRNIETGKHWPTATTARRLATALGVEPHAVDEAREGQRRLAERYGSVRTE